jgi:hypothetical protein
LVFRKAGLDRPAFFVAVWPAQAGEELREELQKDTSSLRPSPPQVCEGEGDDKNVQKLEMRLRRTTLLIRAVFGGKSGNAD